MQFQEEEFALSAEELAIVMDSAWIMAKLRITQKVYALFGRLSHHYSDLLAMHAANAGSEVTAIAPKIYRGESYRQLPYVMMDHPRFFKKEDVLAIRSFFWWGNHFSIHLVLGGRYKLLYEKNILKQVRLGIMDGWYVNSTNDPWQHYFEPDNYGMIVNGSLPAIASDGIYLKLAKQHSLKDWQHAETFFLQSFDHLVRILQPQPPESL
ncbi:MAG: hypothetical protein H7Y03_10575 [Chitinophagaceae bacterium]|nr:hypothetical protein [Chitinophagaceae bacterium]